MASDMTFESAVKAFFDYQMRNVFTSMPAIVMQVTNMGECRVAVKPLINTVFPDYEDGQEHPTIFSVPVLFPSSSTSAFTFPINEGDTVLVVFSQASLDVFKGGTTSPSAPNDYRVFDKRDAIAIPGMFPFQDSINKQSNRTLTHSTSDVVISHNIGTSNECEIRMKPTGKVEITSPLQVEVKAPIATVTATTSATITAPSIYATATTLAAISAPIATVTSATSVAVTAPTITLTGAAAVAVVAPSFTWGGLTVATV